MTLPKEIREEFNLKPGDRLEVSVEGKRIVLVPATLGLDEICSILPRPKRVASLAEIEAAIRARAAHRFR